MQNRFWRQTTETNERIICYDLFSFLKLGHYAVSETFIKRLLMLEKLLSVLLFLCQSSTKTINNSSTPFSPPLICNHLFSNIFPSKCNAYVPPPISCSSCALKCYPDSVHRILSLFSLYIRGMFALTTLFSWYLHTISFTDLCHICSDHTLLSRRLHTISFAGARLCLKAPMHGLRGRRGKLTTS